jgi:hypothetical protein
MKFGEMKEINVGVVWLIQHQLAGGIIYFREHIT